MFMELQNQNLYGIAKANFHLLFLLLIEFIDVTLALKTIQVSSVQTQQHIICT